MGLTLKSFYIHPWYIKRVIDFLSQFGYEPLHLARKVAYEALNERIYNYGPKNMDVLEISGGPYWRKLPFRSYKSVDYPAFDICVDCLDEKFDFIIADNVFEHLAYPSRALKNVRSMLRPGGTFASITPFLIRVHDLPIDCTRWTETGFRYFLNEGGFPMDGIETGSWGTRSAVKANFNGWARWGWKRSRRSEANFPVSVWAFAMEPSDSKN